MTQPKLEPVPGPARPTLTKITLTNDQMLEAIENYINFVVFDKQDRMVKVEAFTNDTDTKEQNDNWWVVFEDAYDVAARAKK